MALSAIPFIEINATPLRLTNGVGFVTALKPRQQASYWLNVEARDASPVIRIAGRHADGMNTQALHPRLADLVKLARDERAAAGRDAASFIVTVFAGMDERWLKGDSRARQSLERVGVDRLILLLSPPFDPGEIRAAGRLLGV